MSTSKTESRGHFLEEDEDDQFEGVDQGQVDDWDDILQVSTQNIISSNSNECWCCSSCSTVNNVKLTIEKYNMECCGCHKTSYMPGKTPIIYSSKWDTPKDYKLRNNLIKPIWICSHCTYQNDISRDICSICEQTKPLHTKNTYIVNPIKAISNDTKQQWICGKCTFNNTNSNSYICIVCGTPKSISNVICESIMIPWKCNICTFINPNSNILECKMCTNKSKSSINPDIDDKQLKTINKDSKPIIKNKCDLKKWACTNCKSTQESDKLRCRCRVCKCKKPNKYRFEDDKLLVFGYCREMENQNNLYCLIPVTITMLFLKYYPIFGSKSIKGIYKKLARTRVQTITSIGKITTYGRYVWKIKISMNMDEIVLVDNDLDVSLITSIYLGVTTNFSSVDCSLRSNGRINNDEQYCRGFQYGDTVIMLFDYTEEKATLSFGLNDDWYGVAFDYVFGKWFTFYATSRQQGAVIELIP